MHPDTALNQAVPLADSTIANIVGVWSPVPETASSAERMLAHAGPNRPRPILGPRWRTPSGPV